MEVCALKNALVSKGERLHLHSPQEEDSEGDANTASPKRETYGNMGKIK